MAPHPIETHAHTNVVSPCGCLSPTVLASEYSRAGYSGLVVTDHLVSSLPIFRDIESWPERVHRFFSGFRAVRDAARGSDLVVYPGFELTLAELPGRDFLVYGIDEKLLAEMPDVCEMNLTAFKGLAAEVGAVIFQAHPYRKNLPVDPEFIDGLEVYNGNPRHDSRNDLASAFAAQHGLLACSGSDAHRPEDIGRCGVALPELPASIFDLVRWWSESPDEIELLVPSETFR